MDSGAEKPAILVVVGHYLPGFKAGGILRSVTNLIDHLHERFSFFVVTRDRDFGDSLPYEGIETGCWVPVGNARVWYLTPDTCNAAGLLRVAGSRPFALVYLNSFFEPMCIHMLVNAKLRRCRRLPTVLAPRGEFAWASLRIKYPKKLAFMLFARAIRLFCGVVWHAANADEAADITRVMRVQNAAMGIAPDLPSVFLDVSRESPRTDAGAGSSLRIVFLSRVSPEKNLDFALRVLARVRAPVSFDIIGPLENQAYWNTCRRLLPALPAHVTARHAGTVPPDKVLDVLARYDLMFFPSGGESFGHVIAESFLAGTPVLTSTATPWRGLEGQGLGWDLPLDDPDAFVHAIDLIAATPVEERGRRRLQARAVARRLLAGTEAREAHVRLFETALG